MVMKNNVFLALLEYRSGGCLLALKEVEEVMVSEESQSADNLAATVISEDPHTVLVEFSSVVADTQEYIIEVRRGANSLLILNLAQCFVNKHCSCACSSPRLLGEGKTGSSQCHPCLHDPREHIGLILFRRRAPGTYFTTLLEVLHVT